MKFSIKEEWENGFCQYKLTDHSLESSVAILPLHGASLHAWNLALTDGPINIIDNYTDRKSTRLNSSHIPLSRMPSSA